MVERGLITWRYGQATVLDVPGLRALVARDGVFQESTGLPPLPARHPSR
jgi:hypothetical protein